MYGFGQEVLVSGDLWFANGFSTARAFRFIGNPVLYGLPSGGFTTLVSLNGPLLGTAFDVMPANGLLLVLNGSGSLAGAINVSGTLEVNGALNAHVVVYDHGYLSGRGSIGGDVIVIGEIDGGSTTAVTVSVNVCSV